MPDGRFISHSLGDSEKFANLEDPRYQVVYMLAVTWADAEGRFIADPVTVNGKLLTRVTWSTPEVVAEALAACHEVGLVTLYEAGGKWFGYVEKFHEHNKIRRKADGSPLREAPSRLPSPPQGDSGRAPTADLLRTYCAPTAQLRSTKVKVKVKVKDEVKVEEGLNTLLLSERDEAPSDDEMSAKPTRARTDLSDFAGIWNDNRGPLPRLLKLNDERKAALRKLIRENGGDVAAAADLFRDATLAVAHDEFWQQRQYGFDNLFVKGRVVARAEQWRNGGMKLSEADRRAALEAARMAAALDDEDDDG